jgi:hypothetical protein
MKFLLQFQCLVARVRSSLSLGLAICIHCAWMKTKSK